MTLNQRELLVKERVHALAKLDPTVSMELDGKVYKLEFNNRAIKELYKQLDFNLLAGGRLGEHIEEPESLTKVVLIGLKAHHPDATEDEVDRIVSIRTIQYVVSCLYEAINAAMPDMTGIPKAQECEDYEAVLDPMMQTAAG